MEIREFHRNLRKFYWLLCRHLGKILNFYNMLLVANYATRKNLKQIQIQKFGCNIILVQKLVKIAFLALVLRNLFRADINNDIEHFSKGDREYFPTKVLSYGQQNFNQITWQMDKIPALCCASAMKIVPFADENPGRKFGIFTR